MEANNISKIKTMYYSTENRAEYLLDIPIPIEIYAYQIKCTCLVINLFVQSNTNK